MSEDTDDLYVLTFAQLFVVTSEDSGPLWPQAPEPGFATSEAIGTGRH